MKELLNHVALDAPKQPAGLQALLKAESAPKDSGVLTAIPRRPFIELPSIERNINENSQKDSIWHKVHLLVQCPEDSSKSFTPHHSPLRLNSPPGKWVQPADRSNNPQFAIEIYH